jgi:hypothetical protein
MSILLGDRCRVLPSVATGLFRIESDKYEKNIAVEVSATVVFQEGAGERFSRVYLGPPKE